MIQTFWAPMKSQVKCAVAHRLESAEDAKNHSESDTASTISTMAMAKDVTATTGFVDMPRNLSSCIA